MPNTSNNAARVTTQTYQHEIARGRVPGAELFGGFGILVAAGAVTKNVVWPKGNFIFPNQTTGENVSLVSTSTQDSLAGTGIKTIEVHYLDVNLVPQKKSLILDGTTPVTGQLSGVRFIQKLHLLSAGSNLAAQGDITAYKEGSATTVYNVISTGDERGTSSLRMVPKGKIAFLQGATMSSISGTAAARVRISLVATELEGHQYFNPEILIPFSSIGLQDGGLSTALPIPFAFKEGTTIGLRATSDKAATISGDWFGWLEDA